MTAAQIFAPFLGGILIEVLHWYLLREKLDFVKYQKMLRSPLFWTVTIAMIVLGRSGRCTSLGLCQSPNLSWLELPSRRCFSNL